MADALKKEKQASVTLIESSGGVFEVFHDGQKIYSKKATGRFPTLDEILQLL
ncbi:MAG: Rdx family protein [bacterium ADurb.Bin478]|nr:MAG: Rdx family protein [bacterium ADurb.Bin478]